MSEFATLLRSSWPKAKKQHKCKECGRYIEIGEKYLYEAMTYDGDFHTHKTCEHCYHVRQHINNVEGMFYFGQVYEDIYEMLLNIGEKAKDAWLERLYVAGMTRKWRKKDGSMWRVIKN